MQISSILLKLKGYDDDLGEIDTNTGSISTNSGLISTNEGNISNNSGLISANTGNISSNSGLISTNTGNISSNLGKINDNTSDISSNLKKINDNKDDIADKLGKINSVEKEINLIEDIYNQTFTINNMKTNSATRNIFKKNIDLNFNKKGILKIKTFCNYKYDEEYNFKHTYYFTDNTNDKLI